MESEPGAQVCGEKRGASSRHLVRVLSTCWDDRMASTSTRSVDLRISTSRLEVPQMEMLIYMVDASDRTMHNETRLRYVEINCSELLFFVVFRVGESGSRESIGNRWKQLSRFLISNPRNFRWSFGDIFVMQWKNMGKILCLDSREGPILSTLKESLLRRSFDSSHEQWTIDAVRSIY